MSNERMKSLPPRSKVSPPEAGLEGRRILATGLRRGGAFDLGLRADGLDLAGVGIDRGHLSRRGVDGAEGPGIQLVLNGYVDLGRVGRDAPPPKPNELSPANAPELEDLEHVDHVDARGQRGGEADHHEDGPTGVEVTVVVAVGDEAKGEGDGGEDQRPAV